MELLPILGKRRIAACEALIDSALHSALAYPGLPVLLGDLITKSLIPITRTNATYELAAITIEAIRTRTMDWPAVSKAVLKDVGGYVVEQVKHCILPFLISHCCTDIQYRA